MTLETLLDLFTALAAISLFEAATALRGGFRFLRAFESAASEGAEGAPRAGPYTPPAGPYAPPASLILPFRGLDPGLEENLEAFFRQRYPDYRLLLVTDGAADPAVDVAERVRERNVGVPARLLIAGAATGRSQKVHNLLHAMAHIRDDDEVIAFGDSDIRPPPNWLEHLVATLADPAVGVSSSYRWYVPVRGGFASVLRSVWNAGIASLMSSPHPPFAWGGAMALRREAFERAGIVESWAGTLSDDYAVTGAVESLGLAIRFEPRCLGFTFEDCSAGELLEWSSRQLAITRIYQPHLWRLGLAGELFANLTLWGGLAALSAAAIGGASALRLGLLGSLLAAAYAARCAKGWLRLRAVRTLFPERWEELRGWRHAYVLWSPLSSLVSLVGLLRSALTREITWRGIRYRMISPTRTEVLSD